jgi:hypothetical protein
MIEDQMGRVPQSYRSSIDDLIWLIGMNLKDANSNARHFR